MIKRTLFVIFISSSSLLGCVTTPTISAEHRPSNWGKVIHQANNFYQISEQLFRSEQPNAELIPQLKTQHIDAVINLRSRNADLAVLPSTDFKLIHIPIDTWAMNREDLLQVMQHIQQAQTRNQKVLIHCYHGSDRTGASIAMYRIIFENWQTEDALNEMKHGGYGFHPVWINIEKIFSPENIKWIRQQLSNPS
ncbi:protein tyrosine phosphatase [Acinetobacter sp. ANC 4470]|uniref:dual specificity protein phosphatase family protein n=1 Tax=Acinetobacter sp. ANC 4470 TaxID=1977881 RepID=UPI000A342B1D|nr:dual specificity protein phosphatase family protein [Acinetobacter sp. ANC 4470]OTG66947.1 protein tyrosine phosphatase [Acinetobacter sp. ANC 4470]